MAAPASTSAAAAALGAAAAELVPADAAGLRRAGEALRLGRNVAFPTETVYGLGGNALDARAVQNIFVKKGRPLTDPLIVHVLSADAALELVETDAPTRRIFEALAARFWPGPLTLVLRARGNVPDLVCAGTGFVGVRCPAHPIARRLLEESGLPIAAPSANRFGHVSPTSAAHVMDDLGAQDLLVLDGGDVASGGACAVGIESTVLGLGSAGGGDAAAGDAEGDDRPRELTLFRKGGVSEQALRAALDEAGLGHARIVPPCNPHTAVDAAPQGAASQDAAGDSAAGDSATGAAPAGAMAPGQCITHYAPDADTWLLASEVAAQQRPADGAAGPSAIRVGGPGSEPLPLSACAVVDFGGALASLRAGCAAYRDVSPTGEAAEAARQLFEALRWTETTGATHVLLQEVPESAGDLAPSVADRLFRAASGKVSRDYELL